MEKLKIEYTPLKDLKPNEYNPKQMSEKEAEDLRKSILEFGVVDPIIVNKAKRREGIIIGGHQRYKIYQELNYKLVPVIYLNISDLKKERELCLRLSKNTGSWDYDLLANFDQELLLDVGFGEEELMMEFGLNEVEEIDVDEERLDILTVEMPEVVRLKARQSFYCDGVDEFNKIKDFFKTSKVGILDKDKLLKVIDND